MMPAPGFQKPMPYLFETDARKSIDLLVRRHRRHQVGRRALFRLDQVIAVHRRGHGHLRTPRLHELEQRHLRGRVLHRNAIRREIHIVQPAAIRRARVAFPQVPVEDLLRQGQRAAHDGARRRDAFRVAGVDLFNHANVECHSRSLSSSCVVVSQEK
jgi:hypothetical protein